MSDVVLTLPVRVGDEALMFGRFLSSFLEKLSIEQDRADADDGPHLMMRSDPCIDGQEMKVFTFQRLCVASAFAGGWDRIRGAGVSLRR